MGERALPEVAIVSSTGGSVSEDNQAASAFMRCVRRQVLVWFLAQTHCDRFGLQSRPSNCAIWKQQTLTSSRCGCAICSPVELESTEAQLDAVNVGYRARNLAMSTPAMGRQPALATAKTGRSSRMPTRTTFDRIQHRTKCRLPVSRRLRTTAALRNRSARRRASGSGRAHRGSLFSGDSPDAHKSDVTAKPPHDATGSRTSA